MPLPTLIIGTVDSGGIALLKFPARSWRNSIFFKMVTTYVIIMIPIVMLSVYLYNWSYENAREEISRSTEMRLASYLQELNREVGWLELQMFDLLEDSEINRITVSWELMDDVQRRSGIKFMLKQLTSLKNSSVYIKDVFVHNRAMNRSMSALRKVYDFDGETFAGLHNRLQYNEGRFIQLNHTLHLAAAKQSGTKGEEPLFIVHLELDTDQLRASLEQMDMYPESRSLLLYERTGFTIESQGGALMLANGSDSFVDVQHDQVHMNDMYLDDLQFSVMTYLPKDVVRKPLGKFVQWAWIYAFVSLLAVMIYFYFSYKKIHRPLFLLIQSFKRMEGGELDIHIEHKQKDEFGYLYDRFNYMIARLKRLIDQDFKQKMMMQKAELRQLQSQINPHFLYNSFFILHSMAKVGDYERIEQFTLMIGEYFRFITRGGEDRVRLADEVRHSRMYTEIQKLRFSRRIQVQFDELPKTMEELMVPKLILQPVIENAYEHSLENLEQGQLRITFAMHPPMYDMIVENSGELADEELERLRNLLADEETCETTGILNIHRRLRLTYGDESGLIVSQSPELGGLQVVIRIQHHAGEVSERVSTANRG